MKKKVVTIDEALATIALPKACPAPARIDWREHHASGWPRGFKFRATLEAISEPGVTLESTFVDVFYKQSLFPGVADNFSAALVYHGYRILAIDENGPSKTHINKVGRGLPAYQQRIGLPHLHRPVAGSMDGYAEPLSRTSLSELWRIFMERANITTGPEFEYPIRDALL